MVVCGERRDEVMVEYDLEAEKFEKKDGVWVLRKKAGNQKVCEVLQRSVIR
jgi:lipoate-protein ligase B